MTEKTNKEYYKEWVKKNPLKRKISQRRYEEKRKLARLQIKEDKENEKYF